MRKKSYICCTSRSQIKKIPLFHKKPKQDCKYCKCFFFIGSVSLFSLFCLLLQRISNRTAEIAFYPRSIFNVLVNWWVLTRCQGGTVDVNLLSRAAVGIQKPSICGDSDWMWQTERTRVTTKNWCWILLLIRWGMRYIDKHSALNLGERK